MSRLVLLALVLLPACAPAAGGGVPISRPEPTRVIEASGRAASIGSGEEVFVAPKRFSAPRAPVWDALLAAHAQIRMPLDGFDAGAGQTVTRFVVNGRLLGEPVSRYLTCGSAMGVAEVADHYQVEVQLQAILASPQPGATEIRFQFSGMARDRFTSTAPRPCFTRGGMEERFAAQIRERLGLEQPATVPAATPPDRVPPVVERAAAAPTMRDEAVPAPALPVRASHPALLVAGGVAAGGLGTLLGSRLGADCEQRCLNARGVLGPLVANSVLIPLGTHALNRGRGNLVQSFLISAGWAAAGVVLAGFTDQDWPVYAVAPGQLLTSVLMERASTGPR